MKFSRGSSFVSFKQAEILCLFFLIFYDVQPWRVSSPAERWAPLNSFLPPPPEHYYDSGQCHFRERALWQGEKSIEDMIQVNFRWTYSQEIVLTSKQSESHAPTYTHTLLNTHLLPSTISSCISLWQFSHLVAGRSGLLSASGLDRQRSYFPL